MTDYMIDSEDNLDEFFQEYSSGIDLNNCFYHPDVERMFDKYKQEIIDLNNCFYYGYNN